MSRANRTNAVNFSTSAVSKAIIMAFVGTGLIAPFGVAMADAGDSTITGKMTSGSISTANGQVTVDADGTTKVLADGSHVSISGEGIGAGKGKSGLAVTEGGVGITFGEGESGSSLVTTDGTISAAAGGNRFAINNTGLSLNNGKFAADGSGNTTVAGTLDAAGKKFQVDENGKVSAAGANFNGNKVEGVAAGEADTDAVNKGQLDAVSENVRVNKDNITNLGEKLTTVEASIAAESKKHTTVSTDATKSNLTVTKTDATDDSGANYEISLKENISVGTVTASGPIEAMRKF